MLLANIQFMTRIAIPHWQGRVSPVFDVAGRVMLAELDAGLIQRCGELLLGSEDAQGRSQLLRSSGVEVLICGAISWPFELAVTSSGIAVISQICGELDIVLSAYASGRLQYCRMPGCRGRHGSGRCGGRCRGGRFFP